MTYTILPSWGWDVCVDGGKARLGLGGTVVFLMFPVNLFEDAKGPGDVPRIYWEPMLVGTIGLTSARS